MTRFVKKQKIALLLSLLFMLVLLPLRAFAEDYSCTASIPVRVTLTGEIDTEFVIRISTEENAPMPEKEALTIRGSGKVTFEAITYTAPGDYHYTVAQQEGREPYLTYDDTVYHVTVRVSNTEEGGLAPEIWAVKDQQTDKTPELLFANIYDPSGTKPSPSPSAKPSPTPGTEPSPSPSAKPSPTPGTEPSPSPSAKPSPTPGTEPSPSPSVKPSPAPGTEPTPSPSREPSATPGTQPSPTPSSAPGTAPGTEPTPGPGGGEGGSSEPVPSAQPTPTGILSQFYVPQTSDQFPLILLVVIMCLAAAGFGFGYYHKKHQKDDNEHPSDSTK